MIDQFFDSNNILKLGSIMEKCEIYLMIYRKRGYLYFSTKMNFTKTVMLQGDEVEDLYRLLSRVAKAGVDAFIPFSHFLYSLFFILSS